MARKGWSVSLVGQRECIERFERIKHLLNGEQFQALILPAAELIRDIAKRLVSLGPGTRKNGKARQHLQDLIFATKGKRSGGLMAKLAGVISGEGPSVIAGIDLKKAPHAHLVEFGHRMVGHAPNKTDTGKRVEKHPFMRPAVDAARPMVVKIIENAARLVLAPFSK